VARTPLFGANSPLYFPSRDVAAKTGTTNDKRDVWVLGYTPNLVVGAWAGNNDNSSMSEISGLIIAPLWRAFMDIALKEIDPETFPSPPRTPDTIKPVLRGMWFDPTELVREEETKEDEDEDSSDPKTTDASLPLSLENAVLGAHSILYFVDKDNPLGPQPANPRDPQFPLWEYPVSLWKASLLNPKETEVDTETPEEDTH
jgi:membrane peptidoglycan carboxypeptidase